MRASRFRQRFVPAIALALAFAWVLLVPASSAGTLEEEEYVMRVVERLAQPAYEGRRSGTLGGKLAARYLAGELARLGVYPLGSLRTGAPEDYIHYFTYKVGEDEERVQAGRNVLGWIPGSQGGLADGCFLLSAHYDHLGYRLTPEGWKYFAGANDNASGVAAVLAVARRYTLLGGRPEYPVVIALFDAEESGLMGSQALVENPPLPLAHAFNINFDMVGALAEHRLLVAVGAEKNRSGEGSEELWAELLEAARGLPAPFEPARMREGWQAGDQYSFNKAGVPFLYLFTGVTGEYDRLTDTPDKLNYRGISEMANLVVEMLARLGAPSQYRWVRQEEDAGGVSPGERRAYLGTIPDFTRKVDGGVALSGVQPGSPAEAAGIRAGDILRRIDDRPVTDLAGLADILRSLDPGQKVIVVVERDGKLLSIEVVVAGRPEK